MGKGDFARFGFKMRFGRISHIARGPKLACMVCWGQLQYQISVRNSPYTQISPKLASSITFMSFMSFMESFSNFVQRTTRSLPCPLQRFETIPWLINKIYESEISRGLSISRVSDNYSILKLSFGCDAYGNPPTKHDGRNTVWKCTEITEDRMSIIYCKQIKKLPVIAVLIISHLATTLVPMSIRYWYDAEVSDRGMI